MLFRESKGVFKVFHCTIVAEKGVAEKGVAEKGVAEKGVAVGELGLQNDSCK